jgi:hypothetical protein
MTLQARPVTRTNCLPYLAAEHCCEAGKWVLCVTGALNSNIHMTVRLAVETVTGREREGTREFHDHHHTCICPCSPRDSHAGVWPSGSPALLRWAGRNFPALEPRAVSQQGLCPMTLHHPDALSTNCQGDQSAYYGLSSPLASWVAGIGWGQCVARTDCRKCVLAHRAA